MTSVKVKPKYYGPWPGTWHDGWIAWLTSAVDKDGMICWNCFGNESGRWMRGYPFSG